LSVGVFRCETGEVIVFETYIDNKPVIEDRLVVEECTEVSKVEGLHAPWHKVNF
jgi:hypothetical protein